MNNKGLIKEIFVMTLADAITAIAVFFFLVPSHTSISSISGLGIILTHFIPLPLSVITMALNILLLIIGFIYLLFRPYKESNTLNFDAKKTVSAK